MPLTELHISAPSRHKMGPDAKGGTAETTGAMGMASRKHVPVIRDAKPGTQSQGHRLKVQKFTLQSPFSITGTRWVPAFICSDLFDALQISNKTLSGHYHPSSGPVLAPSATPAVDSAKVATVETPNMEPMSAAMASARYALDPWPHIESCGSGGNGG